LPAWPFTDTAPSAPAVRRLLQRAYPLAEHASLTVHRDDDMYAFGIGTIGVETVAAMAYFRAGASMMDPISKVAEWRFGSLANVSSFLDFAAGYGRSTRFLVEYLSPERVTVGEIQSDALAFQAEQFRVSTLQSTVDPGALPASRTFEFVFVASLFSHLPRATFGPWLAKLWEMVAPGGVLLFSVHDEVLDDGDAEWDDGFAFIPANEVAALDVEDYGTNFTTETFVRGQLADWIGPDAEDAIRLPLGLCFRQDLWVVTRGPRNPEPLRYDIGPQGALDAFETDGRDFFLTGWVYDFGDTELHAPSHTIARVEISVTDGTIVDADLGQPRPDVAEHFGRPGDPGLSACGWAARGRTRRKLRLTDIVMVTAVCEHGAQFVLDSSRVYDMLQWTGGELPSAPIQRRLLTARAVYSHRGARGLLALAPTVARNEWRRLQTTVRAATKRPSNRVS
jgi:SAM-dependent methyltransferase